MTHPLWPLGIYTLLVLLLTAFLLALSYFLGQRHCEMSTGEPYESGMIPTGTGRMRFNVQFYRIAMFFVIFDLEAVFIYAWAVAVREAGWAGYMEILIFIGVLAAAFIYLWREGALDWKRREPQ